MTLLDAYINLCFGAKIRTEYGDFSYTDINHGRSVSYDDFVLFLHYLKKENNKRNLFNT